MLARCCYCGEIATGRYCFINKEDKVVDNPYCKDHSVDVFHQTKRGLASMHSTATVSREFMLNQRWSREEDPPMLPTSKQELLSRGGVYIH